jgi:hypothetical protein
MRPIFFACAVLALGCGSAPLEVTMNAENNSGQIGLATFTDRRDGLEVSITLEQGNDTSPQAVHLHTGRCGDISAKLLVHPENGKELTLKLLEGGVSKTILKDVRLADLTRGKFEYVVNAHYSKDTTLYVSCGNLPHEAP